MRGWRDAGFIFPIRRAEAAVLVFCANAALVQSRMEEAASLYEQALAIAREQESRRLVAMVMFNLSLVYGEIGENEQGERLALEALSIHREIGNRRSEGLALGQVGWFEQMRGAYAQATTHVLGALAIHREIGNRRGEASMLAELGEFEQVQGRMEEARGWFEQTLAVAREVRHSRLEGAVFGLLAVSHAARGAAREAREALDEGARLLEAADDRVELAKLYARRGWSEALLGDRQASERALDEARARASGLGLGPHSSAARTIARCEEAIAARAGR